jgi:hypothetical protein
MAFGREHKIVIQNSKRNLFACEKTAAIIAIAFLAVILTG